MSGRVTDALGRGRWVVALSLAAAAISAARNAGAGVPSGVFATPTPPFSAARGPFGVDVIRPPLRLRCSLGAGGPMQPALALGARRAHRGPAIALIDVTLRAPDNEQATLDPGGTSLVVPGEPGARFYQQVGFIGWPRHDLADSCRGRWRLRYVVHTVTGEQRSVVLHFRLLAPRVSGPGCRRDGRTLARSTESRVFAIGVRVYGCVLSFGHNWLLAGPGEFGDNAPRHVRAAGGFAAFDELFSGAAQGSRQVRVVALRSGRVRSWTPASGADASANAHGDVFALALTRTGTVAWISRPGPPDARNLEVHAAPFRGMDELLDAGPDIDSRSLRLAGQTVTWRSGGEPRRTVVP